MRILLGCREVTPREDIDTPTLLASQIPEFAQNPLHPSRRGGVQCLLALQASAARLHADRPGTGCHDIAQAVFFRAFARLQFTVHDAETAYALLGVPTKWNCDYPSRTRLMYWGGFHRVGGVIGVRPSVEQIVPPGMLHVVPTAWRVWIAPGYSQRTSAYRPSAKN